MTDIDDFSISFQRIVEHSDSTDEVQRRLKHPLSSGQQRVLDQYFERKERQKKVVRRALTTRQVAEFRYQKQHPRNKISMFTRTTGLYKQHKITVIRNSKGKFVSIPEYLRKEIYKK